LGFQPKLQFLSPPRAFTRSLLEIGEPQWHQGPLTLSPKIQEKQMKSKNGVLLSAFASFVIAAFAGAGVGNGAASRKHTLSNVPASMGSVLEADGGAPCPKPILPGQPPPKLMATEILEADGGAPPPPMLPGPKATTERS